jgi:hypothetical protein
MTMDKFQSSTQDAAGGPLGRVERFTPGAALISGLMPRRGEGQAFQLPDLIDRYLRRMKGRAESSAQVRLQDFASGR